MSQEKTNSLKFSEFYGKNNNRYKNCNIKNIMPVQNSTESNKIQNKNYHKNLTITNFKSDHYTKC